MPSIIEVQDLKKSYGDFEAVKGVSFAVEHGELFGFLGPNGAGKTTTIKMLTTLLMPSAGRANINGYDVLGAKDHVRSSIGIVFQEPALDDELTGRENMLFHAWLYGMKREVYNLRMGDLARLVELEDRINEPVKHYSGGMKRRLEIARGILHHPKILFLDEPTIGLDPQTRNKIWGYLRNLQRKEGITLFLTTHYMDEAEYCDRIAIIDHGKIVASGTPTDLKNQTGKSSMNDVFLQLTGHDIRQEEGDDTRRRNLKQAFGR